MKSSVLIALSIGATALLLVFLPRASGVTTESQRFLTILTIVAASIGIVLLWWWTISHIALSMARQSGHRGLLRAVSQFATPRIRRAAAASLAVPALLLPSQAIAADADYTGSEISIDLTWGANVPTSERETAQDDPLEPEPTDVVVQPEPHPTTDLPHTPAGELAKPAEPDPRPQEPLAPRTVANHQADTDPAPGQPAGEWVVVTPGDSLWSIAAQRATNERDIAALVDRIWAANQIVIGNNPNLILPGQELYIP